MLVCSYLLVIPLLCQCDSDLTHFTHNSLRRDSRIGPTSTIASMESTGSYKEYFAMGERLGKKGDELEAFIQMRLRQDEERDNRAFDRERAKAREDAAILEQAKDKEHQRQMELAHANQHQPRQHENASRVKGPKLPNFDETKDSMDAYIRRFERYAVANNWDAANYATYLSSLLKGKALEVYAQMSTADCTNYDRLKRALLRRFQMTEDGYRRRFYTSKMERDETAGQFITRLSEYCDNWIDMAGITKNYEALRNFIVTEQFLHVCPIDVSMHIREKEMHAMEEVAHAAEVFMTAHRIKPGPRERRQATDAPRRSTQEPAKQMSEATSQRTDRTYDRTDKPRNQTTITCFYCQKPGHKANECAKKKRDNNATAAVNIEDQDERSDKGSTHGSDTESDVSDGVAVSTCVSTANQHKCRHWTSKANEVVPKIGSTNVLPEDRAFMRRLPVVNGIVNGEQVKVLRDTGCTAAIIKKDLVKPHQFTTKTGRYITVDQTSRIAQFADVHIDCAYYTGVLRFMAIEDPLCDVILGNLPEITNQPTDFLYLADLPKTTNEKHSSRSLNNHKTPDQRSYANHNPVQGQAAQAVTRAQAVKDIRPKRSLKVAVLPELGSQVEFKEEQKSDASLHQARKWAEIQKTKVNEKTREETSFKWDRGCLYRRTTNADTGAELKIKQLVVPKKHRVTVMKLGHESVFAGHMGINKTTDKVQSNFYWPGMHDDIARFCKSCDTCQRTVPKGSVPKAPLVNPPIITKPFTRVAVDLIGPLAPLSSRKHQYILTMVDTTSRYPKATPLKKIDTVTVAESMLSMFSDIGVPKEVLSDRGTQFTSNMMDEVHRLLSIHAIRTTPYHAQCNGLCEKYNGTLKQMLKRMVQEQPEEWDRFIDPLLFAYREAPLRSLGGFSPFEVLFGRTVRGPMSILRELWSKEEIEDDVRDTYEYVLDLQHRLKDTCKLVAESLQKAQETQKEYFDRKAKPRALTPGDEVLIMLPTDNNKLLMKWRGPYTVKEKIATNNYLIDVRGTNKVFHINMLKQYLRPATEDVNAAVAAITFEDEETEDSKAPEQPTKPETFEDVNINPDLENEKKQQLRDLIEEFQDIFSSKPGKTTLGEHRIELTDDTPVRCKPYPVPYSLYPEMEKEIQSMLKMGVIEPSDSEYSSPIVIVKKKDGTMRYCQDMRQLNKITRFDCETIPDIDAIYTKCVNDKFFSKVDFCKGYWQIPMAEASKKFTAFQTPFGHFQYLTMPFGLINSGQTYSRVARKLLKGLLNIDNYIDDVLAHTSQWQQHLDTLRALFERIREAKMKIRPTKCYFGYSEIGFTGHDLADGELRTQEDKVEKIRKFVPPKTKKQLRSFLGTTGFYRKFIPNYAEKAKPLTDLTSKGHPEKLIWCAEHQAAFDLLREQLCADPVLKIPDVKKPFVLRTDASEVGLGAVLMQEHDGQLFPVTYLSKKLLPRERNYSVVEKECLAIVWAVERLVRYLYGREFVLQTDHESLKYLQKAKHQNQRVMRWALFLQQYRYRVEYVKGSENHAADYLSRCSE